MRKKTKGRKLASNSSQNKGKVTDRTAESTVFADETESEVQVPEEKILSSGEDLIIKNDNEHVVAVIDKSPAKSKTSEESNTVDDDDDVPEDVSWKSSKESAIRERTLEKEIILDAKRKEKQARIERDERLREQKERKRAREYSRLPMEVLEQVAKRQKSQENEDLSSQSVDIGNHMTFDSSSEDEQDDDDEEDVAQVSEEMPEIKVLVLPREVKKPKKMQQSASLFLREHLFGDRIQRIPASKDSDRTRKYKTIAPALKFSKKTW